MTPELVADPTPYTEILEAFAGARRVLIAPHVSPDGDGIGSMLSLREGLIQAYPNIERIDGVIAGKLPDIYNFMPGIETVVAVDNEFALKGSGKLAEHYDVCVAVDCGSLERLGPAMAYFEAAETTINIDHHVSNARFSKLNVVEITAASTGEVVGRLLDAMGVVDWTQSMATNIYVTLMMDTGGFRYANTTPVAFELAARLVRAGADPEQCYKRIYEDVPVAQAQLRAEAVINVQFLAGGRLAWTSIRQEQIQRLNALDEHVEGVIDALRLMAGVRIAILFKETRDGLTKLSLRSNDVACDVSKLAGQFGGGGHKMAAGANVDEPINQAEALVLPVAEALAAS